MKLIKKLLFTTEPIQSLLRNMKSTYEYSFHQHQLLSAAAFARQEPTESAMDLTKKRRYSVESETQKTNSSPSSFEESPQNTRESPNHHAQAAAQFLLQHRHHMNIPKISTSVTPEHAVQYQHYNYEQISPSTTTSSMIKNSRSPMQIFDTMPMIRKMENISPPPQNFTPARTPPSATHHHESYDRFESSGNKSNTPPLNTSASVLDHHHHDDSNDVPAGGISNISSSSSIASSQKSPTSSTNSSSMMVLGRDGKLSRPFKAYPKDPLSLAAAGSILDQTSAEKYAVFRKRMLEQIHAANGGNAVVNNPKMRRITSKSSVETNNNEPIFTATKEPQLQQSLNMSGFSDKDESYFERRKKNNAAAKKSRDRRRIKEDEIAIRAAFLERENIELKFELAAARKQLAIYGAGITSS